MIKEDKDFIKRYGVKVWERYMDFERHGYLKIKSVTLFVDTLSAIGNKKFTKKAYYYWRKRLF